MLIIRFNVQLNCKLQAKDTIRVTLELAGSEIALIPTYLLSRKCINLYSLSSVHMNLRIVVLISILLPGVESLFCLLPLLLFFLQSIECFSCISITYNLNFKKYGGTSMVEGIWLSVWIIIICRLYKEKGSIWELVVLVTWALAIVYLLR